MKKGQGLRARGSAGVPPGAEPPRRGIVVAHNGVSVDVRFETGGPEAVRVKRRSGHVVGDDVLVRDGVLERLERRTELRRRDALGGVHLVGANLDVLGIVVASFPPPPAGFIDRAVVSARAAGLEPFLVINKCDLEQGGASVAGYRATYGDTLPMHQVSAATGEGVQGLRRFLAAGHRGALIGTTGVGKSSLLNVLCPQAGLKVGGLNTLNYKGCNTTTVATLHSLPEGGELVDTPGFQDFGLIDITIADLAAHFPGFEAAREISCRFSDCRHRSEPGCAVRELAGEGRICGERFAAYQELLREVEAVEEEARRRGWRN